MNDCNLNEALGTGRLFGLKFTPDLKRDTYVRTIVKDAEKWSAHSIVPWNTLLFLTRNKLDPKWIIATLSSPMTRFALLPRLLNRCKGLSFVSCLGLGFLFLLLKSYHSLSLPVTPCGIIDCLGVKWLNKIYGLVKLSPHLLVWVQNRLCI